MFKNPLRKLLASNKSTYGLWVTLESATVTEIAAEIGVDWVVIDMEHGSLDYRDVLHHLRAAKGSDMAVLARVPETSVSTIKKCLDLGVHGILLPLIRTDKDLKEGFGFARYPTVGLRGIGGERAVRWGFRMEEYLGCANEETLVIPLIETAEASRNIESILAVPGLEAVFFGPADLSASCGHLGVWEGPGIASDIIRIANLAHAKGIHTGVVGVNTEDVLLRQSQGFRMIGLGSDAGMMIRQLKSLLGTLKGEKFSPGWF
jgi:2-keto-3-deoxy-L-rhamnonate aldolase RhmA